MSNSIKLFKFLVSTLKTNETKKIHTFIHLIPTLKLTEDETNTIKTYITSIKNSERKKEIVDRFNADITALNLLTLEPETWLGDEVINAFCKLCLRRSSVTRSNVYYFNTFFREKIFNNQKYKYEEVKNWTATRHQTVDIFSFRLVVYIINVNKNHWILCYVDMQVKEIVILDSMHNQHTHIIELIFNYLKDEFMEKKKNDFQTNEWRSFDGDKTKVPHQGLTGDCGVYACYFANVLFDFFSDETNKNALIDRDTMFNGINKSHIKRMRKQMQLDILRGQIYPLTSTSALQCKLEPLLGENDVL